MSCTIMERSGAPKRVRHIALELPDDLMLVIFSMLDFRSKVYAGQVCKKWDQLLKASSAGAKQWGIVYYNADTGSSSQAINTSQKVPLLEHFENGIGRWITNRAGAIESVEVSATLSSDERGVATMKVLESSLPLVAGCLSKHGNTTNLTFYDGSPFASPLLSSTNFLTFLCPMVKSLRMWDVKAPITASQFAAICELSMLKNLDILCASEGEAQRGLQEMTDDISKLKNLTSLRLGDNPSLLHIPESISCLQQLNHIIISRSPITELPSGLGRLANLAWLQFDDCGPLRFPRSLLGLTRLTFVALSGCCLEAIPEALCDIPSLTSLVLSVNDFVSRDGWPWWPTTLSRLTNLKTLDLSSCDMLSLPPQISGLRGLQMLDVDGNSLTSLPEELSCLQSLNDLQAGYNFLATVPVSVLSALTVSSIDLACQFPPEGSGFQVSSCLLPILHPGLVKLDLRQKQWDPLSLCHLGRAMVEVANRAPTMKILWRDTPDLL